MSRSGYSDDTDDQWGLIKWRGQVASAIRGKRGQAFLRELLESLDAMPEKRLIARELRIAAPAFIPPQFDQPQVCALGAVGVQRGVDLESLNPYDYKRIAEVFGIAYQMVKEIEFENDEQWFGPDRTPEARWQHMHDWATRNLKTTGAAQ